MLNHLSHDITMMKIDEELRRAAMRTDYRMKRELDRSRPLRRTRWRMPRRRYAFTAIRRGQRVS
jgi:hypothetical protein